MLNPLVRVRIPGRGNGYTVDRYRLGRVQFTDGTGVKTVPESAGVGFCGPVALCRGQQGK